MAMKDFGKFFEEASVKGNPAFPSEGGKKEGEKNYLSDVEKRAKGRGAVVNGQPDVITAIRAGVDRRLVVRAGKPANGLGNAVLAVCDRF